MSMLTLLIPVDGSDYSRRAVDYAIRRAAATQGPTRVHLSLIHISEPTRPY